MYQWLINVIKDSELLSRIIPELYGIVSNKKSMYCSAACVQAAYRKRKSKEAK